MGGKRKTRPPKRRKQVTTSEDENLLEHCAKTMHVTCVAMSLDSWSQKGNMAAFAQHGSCFCKHKNSLWPQANNSLSWSCNNSYCAFGAYASCHVTCVQQTMNCEPLQASALSFLFENGEFAVILIPTTALSPPLWALG